MYLAYITGWLGTACIWSNFFQLMEKQRLQIWVQFSSPMVWFTIMIVQFTDMWVYFHPTSSKMQIWNLYVKGTVYKTEGTNLYFEGALYKSKQNYTWLIFLPCGPRGFWAYKTAGEILGLQVNWVTQFSKPLSLSLCRTHMPTFWHCLKSTCLHTNFMRGMAWWHKCIHQEKKKRLENWGHMAKHAERAHFFQKCLCLSFDWLVYVNTALWWLLRHGATVLARRLILMYTKCSGREYIALFHFTWTKNIMNTKSTIVLVYLFQ